MHRRVTKPAVVFCFKFSSVLHEEKVAAAVRDFIGVLRYNAMQTEPNLR